MTELNCQPGFNLCSFSKLTTSTVLIYLSLSNLPLFNSLSLCLSLHIHFDSSTHGRRPPIQSTSRTTTPAPATRRLKQGRYQQSPPPLLPPLPSLSQLPINHFQSICPSPEPHTTVFFLSFELRTTRLSFFFYY